MLPQKSHRLKTLMTELAGQRRVPRGPLLSEQVVLQFGIV